MFDFTLLEGDRATVLSDPKAIILTETAARKYFGDADPMGKTLLLNREHTLTVTGILEDVVEHSSMQFDMLMPMQFNLENNREWYRDWGNFFVYTFIQCREDTDPDAFMNKISGVIVDQGGQTNAVLALLPMKDRYFFFYSDRSTVIIFLCVAVFIILIASFNFVNLSTSLSMRRSREITMRKILGAKKNQIVLQSLGESFTLTSVAAATAVVLFVLFFPVFQSIIGEPIRIDGLFIVFSMLSIALLTALAAGLYPAFVLSGMKVSRSIKDKPGRTKGRLRQAVVIVQFVLSILLLLGMAVVYRQARYVRNRGIGYRKDHIVQIPMGGGSETRYIRFANELRNLPGVIAVTGTRVDLPYFGWRINAFRWEGKDAEENISINYNVIDYDFIETMGLRLLKGNAMAREGTSDDGSAVYINRQMARLMDTESAAGSVIMYGDEPMTVIGVIEDFHFRSITAPIEPLILHLFPREVRNVLVRIAPENRSVIIEDIRNLWKTSFPDYPFQYRFMDEASDPSLARLSRLNQLLTAFAVVAVVVSCLGLYGLASLTAERSTKEIGIRKVHGASTVRIIGHLTLRYTLLVLVANIITWPLAYLLTRNFLNQFAYRTEVPVSMYVMIGIVSVAIAFFSVAYKSFQAARANPIESLRYE